MINTSNTWDLAESDSGLDQVEQSSQQKPSPVESDCCQDGKPKSLKKKKKNL